MAKLLLEDCWGEFVIDRKSIVKESVGDKALTRASGRFGRIDFVNENHRKYTKTVWENNLKEGSPLRLAIAKNAAFGLLEHPKDGLVDHNSPTAILVTRAEIRENEIVGDIIVLNTFAGRELAAKMEVGYNPLVSSRGYGSLVTDSNGIDIVQDDYICEGWDVVMRPSFTDAEVIAIRTTTTTTVTSESTTPASTPISTAVNTVAANPAASVGAAKVKSQPALVETVGTTPATDRKPTKGKTMEAREIKQSLNTIAALDPVSVGSTRFSEGLAQLKSLHNEVAVWLAEDSKRSYEASELHEAIKLEETRWSKAVITGPQESVARLTEDRKKLLRVTEAVGARAIETRTKLTEATAKLAKSNDLNKKLLERGRSWKQAADRLQEQLDTLNAKYDVSTTALDMLATDFKRDITALGRKLITVQHEAALKGNAALSKQLTEATTPGQVEAVYDAIMKGATKAAATEAKPSTTPVTESTPAPAAPAKPIVEALKPQQLSVNIAVPTDLSESVRIVRRLSQSNQLAVA